MKVCCCEWKGMVGNHCEPCEGGAHAACTDMKEMTPPKDAEVEQEFERAATSGRASPGANQMQLLQGAETLGFLGMGARTLNDGDTLTGPAQGVWTAFHYDMSEVVFFPDELSALRYAVRNSMHAQLIPFGVGVREHIKKEGIRDE